MAQLELEIVTAEGTTYSGTADYVVAPGELGQLTVLPSHAPLITNLDAGELRFGENGEEHLLAVMGGFLEVRANRVTVLANAAEEDEAIDLERAEEAVRRARERIASQAEDIDLERALASLRRAQIRVRTARRRRGRADTRSPSRQS